MKHIINEGTLQLDKNIFYWVLIPIFAVMLLSGILRHYLTITFSSNPPASLAATSHKQFLTYARILRKNANLLTNDAFSSRVHQMCTSDRGLTEECAKIHEQEIEDENDRNPNPTGMMDPSQMIKPMIHNMTSVVPNMLLMGWVTYFFAGFLVVKLPFTLFDKFKVMLQRGVDVSTVDVSYVSSVSWYLINMLGLQSIYTLILGHDSHTGNDEESLTQLATGGMASQNMSPLGAGQTKYTNIYESEKKELQIVQHTYCVRDCEERLAKSWLKQNKSKID